MRATFIAVCAAFIGAIGVAAPTTAAQESKLEPGMRVVARSPDFVFRDGAAVIPFGSPLDIYRVERVDGARVRLIFGSREGDARASDVVRIEDAEAYFNEQIKANPRSAHGYLMRSNSRLVRNDLAGEQADCEEAIRLEPQNPWGYLSRGEIKTQRSDMKNALADFDHVIRLDSKIARVFVLRGVPIDGWRF